MNPTFHKREDLERYCLALRHSIQNGKFSSGEAMLTAIRITKHQQTILDACPSTQLFAMNREGVLWPLTQRDLSN